MPIEPNKRSGKGEFPTEPPSSPLENKFSDEVLNRAQNRTVLFDYLHLILVGFVSTIRGFLGIEQSKISDRE